ncbi:MAG: APC family permease [Pseudomonadota bacterium]
MKKFETEVRLSREMGLMDATMIGVGAMIGAGIFVLIGIAAGVAGPALILVFALNGLVALLTAMSYAELGSCFHNAGGGYLWVKEGLPKWNGFLSGWMDWFAHAVACSLYALGFGAYFGTSCMRSVLRSRTGDSFHRKSCWPPASPSSLPTSISGAPLKLARSVIW